MARAQLPSDAQLQGACMQSLPSGQLLAASTCILTAACVFWGFGLVSRRHEILRLQAKCAPGERSRRPCGGHNAECAFVPPFKRSKRSKRSSHHRRWLPRTATIEAAPPIPA
jgi:hypothetical protein